MKLKKNWYLLFLLCALVFVLSACAPRENKQAQPQTKTAKETKVAIGVMAAPDCAPLYVARDKGYFRDEGIAAKIYLFKDPHKREAAASAGQINVSMTDFVSFTSYMRHGKAWQLLTQLTGRFGVAVPDKSPIKKVAQLKGKKVANVPRQVTDYYFYRTLKANGVAPKQVTTLNVPQIPQRLEMIKNGQADAAVLPQTFLTLAQLKGCRVLTASKPNFALTALAVKGKLVKDARIRRHFLKAYNRAVKEINNHPAVLQQTLRRDLSLPAPVAQRAPRAFPRYQLARTANAHTMADVLRFARRQGFFTQKVQPRDYIIAVK